jgi:hypothetical protein
MTAGWAFRRLYASESQRRKALPGWIHEYNHHRRHTAIGGHPPISRLTNLSEQYTQHSCRRSLCPRASCLLVLVMAGAGAVLVASSPV